MLALPVLHAAIPTRLAPKSSRERGAILARSLIGAGIIDAQTLPAAVTADHMATCKAAFAAWLDRQMPNLRCLAPVFMLSIAASGAEQGHEASVLCGQIECHSDGGNWSVGDALEALEAIRPGLGATVLRTLERLAGRTIPLFAPTDVLMTTVYAYWHGDDDEACALEEACGDNEADRESMRLAMVTREMIDREYPAWAIEWVSRRKVLSSRALRKLARESTDQAVRAVIAEVVELSAIVLPERDTGDEDEWFVGHAGVLRWRQDDQLTMRLVDDYEQMACESGGYEHSGSWDVRLDRPQDLLAWAQAMKPWFRALVLIDSLIWRLSQGNWPSSTEKTHGSQEIRDEGRNG